MKSIKTLRQAAEMLQNGGVSSVELVSYFLDRIDKRNERTNSFVDVFGEEAIRNAEEADRSLKRGKIKGPLHGIPIAVKDLFNVKGHVTRCGSLVMSEQPANENSFVVTKLLNAGAILLGKLNLHEFAFGPTSENQAFGPVRNPYDLERIAGGSSGGSAAAVADGLCLGTLGTDSGGSIRIPASLCGVVGIKPTIGLTSRTGVFPLSWTLDNVGPLANTVDDCALLLDAVADYDPEDPLSVSRPASSFSSGYRSLDVSKLKIGMTSSFSPLDPEVEENFQNILNVIGETFQIENVEVPLAKHYKPITDILLSCEASAVHDELLKTKFEAYGSDVRPKIIAGSFFHVGEYVQAQKIRNYLASSLVGTLSKIDVLILPTTPITAPKIGERKSEMGDPTFLLGALTRPFSLTGLPAINIPCGFDKKGLPFGLQIAGKALDECTVLAFANFIESKIGRGSASQLP
jgi:aspartyl-tRNA(Asn)/glutamyl-tRNA(Gln) amidotransferase subunit A